MKYFRMGAGPDPAGFRLGLGTGRNERDGEEFPVGTGSSLASLAFDLFATLRDFSAVEHFYPFFIRIQLLSTLCRFAKKPFS